MKNLLHHIQRVILLALLAGFPSCADEEQETNLVEVNFTATLPADARSRSFGDAEQVNTLIVGVFDEQYTEIYRKLYAIEGTSVNVTLALAQSQTYHFVFWAYDNNQGIYDLSNLKSIKMNANALPDPITFAQAESMDAFFAVKEQVIMKGDRDYTIELVRPLAQINVGTTGAPMLALFTAKAAPDTFHPFTNAVSGATDFSWNFSETITETFTTDSKEFNYLAIAYVFAPSTTISIATELTLTHANKSQTVEFPQVEIEGNCRSNIGGNFTSETNN